MRERADWGRPRQHLVEKNFMGGVSVDKSHILLAWENQRCEFPVVDQRIKILTCSIFYVFFFLKLLIIGFFSYPFV